MEGLKTDENLQEFTANNMRKSKSVKACTPI